MCRSNLRVPMSHPPGNGSSTRPKRTSRIPSSSSEYLILAARTAGTTGLAIPPGSIVTVVPLTPTLAPILRRSATATLMSAIATGTLRSSTVPELSSEPNSIGSAAFLAPLRLTSPSSRVPPVISNTGISQTRLPFSDLPGAPARIIWQISRRFHTFPAAIRRSRRDHSPPPSFPAAARLTAPSEIPSTARQTRPAAVNGM